MNNATLELDLPVRPEVQLTGQDGNAFSIMGLCSRALKQEMRAQGYSFEEASVAEAKLKAAFVSGDYDHLLAVAMTNFDVN